MGRMRAVLCLALSMMALGALAAASAGAATARPKAVLSATIVGGFSATVVQGPDAGKAYAGTLRLKGAPGGYLDGTLTVPGAKPIPVSGQLHGRLIGLSFALGAGRAISGTGIVGYDRARHT